MGLWRNDSTQWSESVRPVSASIYEPRVTGKDGMYLFGRKITEERRRTRVKNRRVHMANERTFLAWIRTSIGIMAFGFVIAKFFIPSGQAGIEKLADVASAFTSVALLGVFLVLLGAAAGLLATYRFLKTEKEIMEDTYHPSIVSDALIAILLSSIGTLLVVYLARTL